jgi:hypothetical protein
VEQTGTDLQADKITENDMPFTSKISLATQKGPPVDNIPNDVQWLYVEHYYISQRWYPETHQITGINTNVVFNAGYDDGEAILLYRVDGYDYTAGLSSPPYLTTHPTLNGFTYLASGDGFVVEPNQYATLAVDYVANSNAGIFFQWNILDFTTLNLVYSMPLYSEAFVYPI